MSKCGNWELTTDLIERINNSFKHVTQNIIVSQIGTPLQSTHHREQGLRRTVYFQYELLPSEMVSKTIDSLLSDWSKIVYLYSIVHEFAEQYKNGKFELSS